MPQPRRSCWSRAPWGWTTGAVRPNNKLRLKVHFDDGSTITIARVERNRHLLRDERVDSALPMRYDPADRSYIDIDRPTLLKRHARFDEKLNRDRIREAEDRQHRHRDD